MNAYVYVECPECDGKGGYNVGPKCGYPASMCCGGCYEKVECDVCGGQGEILTEKEDEDERE